MPELQFPIELVETLPEVVLVKGFPVAGNPWAKDTVFVKEVRVRELLNNDLLRIQKDPRIKGTDDFLYAIISLIRCTYIQVDGVWRSPTQAEVEGLCVRENKALAEMIGQQNAEVELSGFPQAGATSEKRGVGQEKP